VVPSFVGWTGSAAEEKEAAQHYLLNANLVINYQPLSNFVVTFCDESGPVTLQLLKNRSITERVPGCWQHYQMMILF